MKSNNKKSDLGASLVEYGLLIALLSVTCIAAIKYLGNNISGKLYDAAYGVNGETIEQPEEI